MSRSQILTQVYLLPVLCMIGALALWVTYEIFIEQVVRPLQRRRNNRKEPR